MKKLALKITNKQIVSGCLISSIAHAIMMNEYPDLSYELSWDGDNYSKLFERYRMTISIKEDYCVGAIRNDEFRGVSQQEIDALINESDFPPQAIDLLKSETLEYVLMNSEDGRVIPVVTSLYYCNTERLLIIANDKESLTADVEALAPFIASMEQQVEYWKDYYEMSEENVVLLLDLFKTKSERFHAPICLTDTQKKMLPGEDINEECIISFAEMNIAL